MAADVILSPSTLANQVPPAHQKKRQNNLIIKFN